MAKTKTAAVPAKSSAAPGYSELNLAGQFQLTGHTDGFYASGARSSTPGANPALLDVAIVRPNAC